MLDDGTFALVVKGDRGSSDMAEIVGARLGTILCSVSSYEVIPGESGIGANCQPC
jgi:hypothetical protein